MKLAFFSLVFLTVSAHAGKLCEVYGISDGPQKLDCHFSSESIFLRCRDGKYFLNSTPVDTAYHEEVEEGPVPLVFKTTDAVMKVMIQEKTEASALLKRKGRISMIGSCF